MGHSTAKHASRKAADSKLRFPLWHHKASGRWAKKVGNKFFYFQRLDNNHLVLEAERAPDFRHSPA